MSNQIYSINRALVGGELECALRMFKQAAMPLSMAKSHLKSASSMAGPAFTADPTRKQQIDAIIAAIENLFASVQPFTEPTQTKDSTVIDVTPEKNITPSPNEQNS